MWATEAFADELRTFVVDAVGAPTVFEPVKVRPWATVWRVETSDDAYYAKQNCPGQAHEAALLSALARISPHHVVPVVAADPDRGLLLTADLGPTVQARGGDHDVDLWCRIVREAALLQREVAPHADELPLAPLPPDGATTYVGDAIGRLNALPPDDVRRLPDDVAERLRALMPTVERWSDQVATLDLPMTINHNDLHANNVVEAADGAFRFFDFADAVAAEPLGALLVALNISAYELGAGPDDLRLRRIADAALEVWSDLAPMRGLRAALPAALQLARLAKVESWRRCTTTMTTDERGEYGSAPADWLGTLLEEPPAGHLPSM